MGYTGHDFGYVVKAVTLACTSRIPWAAVNDAANAVKVKRPSNKVGYFRKTLLDNLEKAGGDVPNELRPKQNRGPEKVGDILAELKRTR